MQKTVNAVFGRTLEESACGAILLAKPYLHNDVNQIFVVPDRFSLTAENLIFDVLNIESTFNMRVVGISKLCREIFTELGISKEILTKEQSLLYIRRAVELTKNNFKIFKKNVSVAFCNEIQNTISLLASSGITSQMIISNSSEDVALNCKLTDLANIYFEYEKLTADKLDANTMLQFLGEIIAESKLVKYSNFYFIGFDALTKQGYSLLENIIKFSNAVTVAIAKADSQSNSNIYDKDLYFNLKSICESNNYTLIESQHKNKLEELPEMLIQNLFAQKLQKNLCDITNLTAFSPYQEVFLIAGQIKKIIAQGDNFNDIAIACNMESYKTILEEVFDENAFSYFMDSDLYLKDMALPKMLISLLKFCNDTFHTEYLFSALKSSFFNFEEEKIFQLEQYMQKYYINGNRTFDEKYFQTNNELFVYFKDFFIRLKDWKRNFDSLSNFAEFIDGIKDIVKYLSLEEKCNELSERIALQGQIKLQKTYEQQFAKVEEVLKNFSLLGKDACNFSDFLEMLEFSFSTKSISTVPISLDCIFVGDFSKSFFERKKYVFALGLNQGKVPSTISDTGIIPDDEIDNLKKDFEISPTVNLINKRNKFKVFSALTAVNNKLFLSYLETDEDGKKIYPASFVKKIIDNSQNINNISFSDSYYFLPNLSHKENLDKLKNSLLNKTTAMEALLAMQNNNTQHLYKVELFSALKKINNEFIFNNFNQNNSKKSIKNADKLFFSNNYTKISQLETYFSCPYLHFIRYGLMPKENETTKIDAKIIGILLHEVAEVFAKKYLTNSSEMNNTQLVIVATKIFDDLTEQKEYIRFFNQPNNKLLFSVIKEESIALVKTLYYEKLVSDFVPTFFEKQFYGEIELPVSKLKVKGVIDRVDIYNNLAKIVDYKTGQIDSSLGGIYFGEKIQLFVYQKALEHMLSKKVVACVYFSIKNSFEKNNKKPFGVEGHIVNNFDYVRHLDNKLGKDYNESEMLGVSLSKTSLSKGEIVLNKRGVIEESLFSNLGNYVLKLADNAVQEIASGFIAAVPKAGACEYCEFKGACKFSEEFDGKRNCLNSQVDSESFEEANDGI